MDGRFYCVEDCFTNHQYFYGGRFYEGYDLDRGLEQGEKPGSMKYFVRLSPKRHALKELKPGETLTPEQAKERAEVEQERAFLDEAIANHAAELKSLHDLARKGNVRGLGKRIQSLEATLRELRAA